MSTVYSHCGGGGTCYLAELREVNVSITDNVVGQVDDLLLQGVQAQHLHGRVEILGVDGGLPQAGLVAPEDRRDHVQLLLRQILGTVKHPPELNFRYLQNKNAIDFFISWKE